MLIVVEVKILVVIGGRNRDTHRFAYHMSNAVQGQMITPSMTDAMSFFVKLRIEELHFLMCCLA